MAMVRAAVRAQADAGCTLVDVFAGIDRLVVGLERPDHFVTVACLRLTPDGRGEALLAGHLPILVLRPGVGVRPCIENTRPPLGIGVHRSSSVAARPLEHQPGDLFVLFTDGLVEVADRDGRMLGIEAIQNLLAGRASAPLAEVADSVFERAHQHGLAADDQTLLLVRAT